MIVEAVELMIETYCFLQGPFLCKLNTFDPTSKQVRVVGSGWIMDVNAELDPAIYF